MSKTKAFLRTDRAIIQALITLLKIKSFESITVQDILDETPVNRATFYAHFHDKYEIAERMQEDFFAIEKDLEQQMMTQKKSNYSEIIQTAFLQKKELVEALLKIHTDRVDLRTSIANGWKEKYLETSDNPNKKMEAEMYAQVMTTFQLAFVTDNSTALFSTNYIDHVMIEVLIKSLQVDANETRSFLYKQLKKRDIQHDNLFT